MIRLINVQEDDRNSIVFHHVLQHDRVRGQSPEYTAVNSGYMRDNGIFTIHEEPEPEQGSYSDFITFNYGHVHERQHASSPRKVGSRYLSPDKDVSVPKSE